MMTQPPSSAANRTERRFGRNVTLASTEFFNWRMVKNMAKHSKCCATEKMCSLTCCACSIDLKAIKPLVNAPKFICQACGRVANKKTNLCKPVLLS